MFEFDEQLAKKDDEVYHFVGYIPVKGRLYELDGLKDGPVDLGKCDEDDWLKTVKPVLDQRIQRSVALSAFIVTLTHSVSYLVFCYDRVSHNNVLSYICVLLGLYSVYSSLFRSFVAYIYNRTSYVHIFSWRRVLAC